jgi:hypothetical protein
MQRRIGTGRHAVGLLPALAFGFVGCTGQDPQAPTAGEQPLPQALRSENVVIVDDPAALAGRLEPASRSLTVGARGVGTDAQVAAKPEDLGVRLTLVGTVRAPVVDGQVVQANDVDIEGKRAVVAYNTAGEVYAGAVQVIDFSHPERPEIVAEVLYRRADVTAVAIQGSHLYVGMSADDPALPTPAMMEELALAGRGLERSGRWLDLPSWACTDLAVHGNVVVAAVGAQDGGLVRVGLGRALSQLGFAAATDLRGVALDGETLRSVGGRPGTLLAHALDAMLPLGSTAIEGYAQEGAKGTIEVYSRRCYLGAGEAGLQVRAGDGGLFDEVTCAQLTALGQPAVVNAVSISNHLGFVAAGPQGVQVVRLGRWRCDGREAEEQEGLRVLGRLGLEEGASCNMVKAKENLLVVAAGAGGVKLVSMSFDR